MCFVIEFTEVDKDWKRPSEYGHPGPFYLFNDPTFGDVTAELYRAEMYGTREHAESILEYITTTVPGLKGAGVVEIEVKRKG